MAIVRWRGWNPGPRRWGPMWPSFFDDEDMDSLMKWPELSSTGSGVDIYETDNDVVVEAQVPGIKEDDVEVTVEGNILTISAEAKEEDEQKEEKKTVYKSTRQMSFSYSTSLPRMVDASQAKAEVENGLVTVRIPKTEEEKPKKIEIKKKS